VVNRKNEIDFDQMNANSVDVDKTPSVRPAIIVVHLSLYRMACQEVGKLTSDARIQQFCSQ